MPDDDDGDDDVAGRVPPLHPDDRLWRHPSEVSAHGHGGMAGGTSTPLQPVATPSPRPVWPIALVAAFVGAALCGGVLALTGNLSVEGDRVVERVNVTPFPGPGLSSEETVDAITARASKSVVRLRITTAEGDSTACGVVVRDDGVVVTSAHEVAKATAIVVVLADGRTLEGDLVGADLPTDVAVISIDDAGTLSVAVLGSSEELEAGAAAAAIGLTTHGESAVSTGVISSTAERLDFGDESLHGMIKTDAPIESAWAGGPLIDASGAVIGITTDLAGDVERFGFATPIEVVRRLADELLAYGKIAHGWLGIEGTDLSEARAEVLGVRSGAEIRRVLAGSPAARAGLAKGDVITEVSDEKIRSSSDLVVALRSYKPGQAVVIGYWSGGRHREVKVTIEHVPV